MSKDAACSLDYECHHTFEWNTEFERMRIVTAFRPFLQ